MLHFTTSSHLVAATSYLYGNVAFPADDMLDHAGSFAMWLADNFDTPQDVYDWRDVYERFKRDTGYYA